MDENAQKPRNTHRITYSETERIGNIGENKQYTVDYNDTARVTGRQLLSDKSEINGPKGGTELERHTNRDEYYNASLNTEKERISLGREPTTCGAERGPSRFTYVQLHDPILFNREPMPNMTWMDRTLMKIDKPRPKTVFPNDEYRFDSHVADNIKGNPYINNIVHKAS